MQGTDREVLALANERAACRGCGSQSLTVLRYDTVHVYQCHGCGRQTTRRFLL